MVVFLIVKSLLAGFFTVAAIGLFLLGILGLIGGGIPAYIWAAAVVSLLMAMFLASSQR